MIPDSMYSMYTIFDTILNLSVYYEIEDFCHSDTILDQFAIRTLVFYFHFCLLSQKQCIRDRKNGQ